MSDSDDEREDHHEHRKRLRLIAFVVVAVLVTLLILMWLRSDGNEYGLGQKIRSRYENAVDSLKAKQIERRRQRIAKHNKL
jgi:type VI protein secretion system component VasK